MSVWIILLLSLFWGGGEFLMAVEEPKFDVVEVLDEVEIRQYHPMILAETEVEGEFGKAGNEGFSRIAGYIFGGNQQKQKIQMTAPVLQESVSGKKRIAFVMPAEKTLQNLSSPNDLRVILKELPARKMAVLKYSGTWSEERYQEKEKELLSILKRHQKNTKGSPILARYNPPWIPWFLRRNEVLIEVE